MSVYTTIYPDASDFKYTDKDEASAEVTRADSDCRTVWGNITALCIATPKDITPAGKVPYKYITEEFEKLWHSYLAYYKEFCDASFNVEYLENVKLLKEHPDWDNKPWLDWNHFDYSNDPDEGIIETKEYIDEVYNKLKGYCCASPQSFADSEEGSFLVDSALGRVQDTKEWLDEQLYIQEFCKLLKKYWSTHEVG